MARKMTPVDHRGGFERTVAKVREEYEKRNGSTPDDKAQRSIEESVSRVADKQLRKGK